MSFPRMPLHIGDYKKSTGHLRAAGHGAYLSLIMHYWANGSLPEAEDQLASIACMTTKEWRKHKFTIQSFFTDGWRHEQIEADLADAWENRERRSRAGQLGNKKRWQANSHKHADRNAFGNDSQCDRTADALGSLPPASRHNKESQQDRTYPHQDEVDGQDVVPFLRRHK
jgi:uncharacterized protein YdaU (DUF1376 family)